jgi:hypothetical protein
VGNNIVDACCEEADHALAASPGWPDWTQGVTLLDLLRFSAESYIKLHDYLSRLQSELNGDEVAQFPDTDNLTGNPLPPSADRKNEAGNLLAYSKSLCAQIKLQVCVKHISELQRSVPDGSEPTRSLR